MKPTVKGSIADLGKLISGIKEHQPNGVFSVVGRTATAAEAVPTLQSIVDALNALIGAHSALKEAVVTADNLSKVNQAFVRDIRLNIQMLYAQSASTLGDFGLAPRKVAVLTPQQRVVAADKARATRAARHTMGSKQKAGITGATPVATTSSSTPAVTATPAATTAGVSGSTGTSTH